MSAIAIRFLPIFLAIAAHAQGTFQNLNFEAAQLVPIPGDPYGAVQFSTAFPGWTGYYGGQQVTSTIPNGLPISFTYDPFIALCVPPAVIMQGSYMVCISGGYGYTPSPNWTPASMAQTGILPTDARSIRLLTSQSDVPGAGRNLVFLDGVEIPLVYLGSTVNYGNMWAGDVTSFAGQSAELRLYGGWTFFDDITFSSSPIPEPSSSGIMLIGVGVLLGIRSITRNTAQPAAAGNSRPRWQLIDL